MRYDSLRKLERNKALVEYVNGHPDLSFREIGQIFGISGVRAWRIYHFGTYPGKGGKR